MTRRRINMRRIREVLRLRYELKLSQRKISKSVRIAQSCVFEYLVRAKLANLNWPLPENLDDDQLEAICFPPRSSNSNQERPPIDFAHIHKEMKRKGVTLQLLWEEYRTTSPDGVGYSHFCNQYSAWAKVRNLWMPQQHKAGEKLFIDYAGMTVLIKNTDGSSYQAQIFIAVMGASNYIYVEATKTQQLADWISSHVRMFQFFGGCTKCLIPDNLKSGVNSADRYEPELNQAYLEMAQHYNVAIVPARVRAPKDKSKAENGVQNAERQILARLRNRVFFSLDELNEEIRILRDELNQRPFQKLEGCRLSVFEEIDKPQLSPLPAHPYVFANWTKGSVGQNYHVGVLDNNYSVPYKFVRQKIEARITEKTVEIFCKGKRIAGHIRCFEKNKYITDPDHYPPEHRAYANCNPENLLSEAKTAGDNVADWVKAVLDDPLVYSMQKLRTCSGALRLLKSYGNSRLNAACGRGMHLGIYSCKSIESMLKTGLDHQPLYKTEVMTTSPHHEFVRGPFYYTQQGEV